MSYTPATTYERFAHNGQYASYKMAPPVDLECSPMANFIASLFLLIAILGVMLLLAPLGMCYISPLSAWGTACQFGGGLQVSQGEDIQVTAANCDNLYKKEQWQEPPKIVYPEALDGWMYTVLAIDPDAPDHPNGTYYLHMMQTNVMGEDLKKGNLEKSLNIAPYVGPAPPQGSGDHRYMFVVYQHCKPRDRLPSMAAPERWMFDLGKWIGSLSIKLIGPKAGLQFKAHF